MGKDEELITLVVHTREFAMKLKEVLEFHEIPVVLEPVELAGANAGNTPMKIRIPLTCLEMSLKILESGKDTLGPLALLKMTGLGKTLLIPVDFSPLSALAVKVGFFLAEKFNVEPVLMHCYVSSYLESPEVNMPDPFDGLQEEELETKVIEDSAIRRAASARLAAFKNRVKNDQLQGKLPQIKFSTALLEGIPELVIQDYCKTNKPLMVVMATREARKKGADLVGSVTGEVIDSCRIPLISIPENYQVKGVDKIRNVMMFCTFTGFDTLVIRWLLRTFDYPSCSFHLLPSGDRMISNVDKKLEDLRFYLTSNYPTVTFHADGFKGGKFEDAVKTVIEENDIQLIIVPNKKSSAFSRFFRPTLAHRILFEKDIPLLVLPV